MTGMAWTLVVFVAAIGALVSNMWLLRELDGLQRQLEAPHKDVAALDERVCGLMYATEDGRLSREAQSLRLGG